MSKSFTLQQLTEGIRDRNVGAEGMRLMEKWSRTGLLRGLNDHSRETMSRLLENQAAQLLREQNSLSTGAGNLTSSGDIRGFTNIAFPIVRRVFGGLISNELVSNSWLLGVCKHLMSSKSKQLCGRKVEVWDSDNFILV